jgi:hypothetical protein
VSSLCSRDQARVRPPRLRHPVEIYQNVLDGIPMFIAVAIFNLFNPGYLLPKKAKWGPYY